MLFSFASGARARSFQFGTFGLAKVFLSLSFRWLAVMCARTSLLAGERAAHALATLQAHAMREAASDNAMMNIIQPICWWCRCNIMNTMAYTESMKRDKGEPFYCTIIMNVGWKYK